MDWLQAPPQCDHAPVTPVIPGLRKNFFMTSKEQLEDIVSVDVIVCTIMIVWRIKVLFKIRIIILVLITYRNTYLQSQW